MRFWDSSALVPLVVAQPASPLTDQWLDSDPTMAIWTLTPVEISSAIRRLCREGALAERAANDSERRVDELTATCHVVIDVEGVKAQARRLLRVHAVRAADALQLAAAVEWAGGRPGGRVLHTLDDRLATAARREGFEVPDVSTTTQR